MKSNSFSLKISIFQRFNKLLLVRNVMILCSISSNYKILNALLPLYFMFFLFDYSIYLNVDSNLNS